MDLSIELYNLRVRVIWKEALVLRQRKSTLTVSLHQSRRRFSNWPHSNTVQIWPNGCSWTISISSFSSQLFSKLAISCRIVHFSTISARFFFWPLSILFSTRSALVWHCGAFHSLHSTAALNSICCLVLFSLLSYQLSIPSLSWPPSRKFTSMTCSTLSFSASRYWTTLCRLSSIVCSIRSRKLVKEIWFLSISCSAVYRSLSWHWEEFWSALSSVSLPVSRRNSLNTHPFLNHWSSWSMLIWLIWHRKWFLFRAF